MASGVERIIVPNGVQTLEPQDLQPVQPPKQVHTQTCVNMAMWCPNHVRLFGFKTWLISSSVFFIISHLGVAFDPVSAHADACYV